MSLALASKPSIDKEQLNVLADTYRRTKDAESLTNVIRVLEPLVRGKVVSIIYYHEKHRGRHVSDFEDMCQEARLKVRAALERWDNRGTFYTFANVVISSHLKGLMKNKHKLKKNMVCDYTTSLNDFLYSDELGEMTMSDKIGAIDPIQEKVVGAMKLGAVISKAISEELSKDKLSAKIFPLFLDGHTPVKIARKVRKPEWMVRHNIGYVVKKVKGKISAKYADLYRDLLPDFSKLVKIECSSN